MKCLDYLRYCVVYGVSLLPDHMDTPRSMGQLILCNAYQRSEHPAINCLIVHVNAPCAVYTYTADHDDIKHLSETSTPITPSSTPRSQQPERQQTSTASPSNATLLTSPDDCSAKSYNEFNAFFMTFWDNPLVLGQGSKDSHYVMTYGHYAVTPRPKMPFGLPRSSSIEIVIRTFKFIMYLLLTAYSVFLIFSGEPKNTANVPGSVVGGIIGGLVIVAVIVIIVTLYLRRRCKEQQTARPCQQENEDENEDEASKL